MSGLIGVCAIMAMVNALTGDWHGAAAFAYVATGMTVVRWAVLRFSARAADRASRGSSAGAAFGRVAAAPGQETAATEELSHAEAIRGMRQELRRLGRDDGELSDDDIRRLYEAIYAFLRYGTATRKTLGAGRLQVTWEQHARSKGR